MYNIVIFLILYNQALVREITDMTKASRRSWTGIDLICIDTILERYFPVRFYRFVRMTPVLVKKV